MAQFLLEKEGLFVGSSSAVNCAAARRIAKRLGPGHVIVTVLCDGGQRHMTKFFNPKYQVSMAYRTGVLNGCNSTGRHTNDAPRGTK